MRISEHLSLTAIPWLRLSTVVPDPRAAEGPKALRHIAPVDRAQAEMRNEVQRMIAKTKKAENAASYARYIAGGLLGKRGRGWATPPFALWLPEALEHVTQPGPFGDDHVAQLPFGVKGVLVDAETQHSRARSHWTTPTNSPAPGPCVAEFPCATADP